MASPYINKPIAVLGAGSWGTALALLLARNGNDVRLWGYEPKAIALMEQQRVNKAYLPGHTLPDNITLYDDMATCLLDCSDVLVVVPSHAFHVVLEQMKPLVDDSLRLAWGTKGLDAESGRLLSDIAAQVFSPELPVAVLAGPSFAAELADNKPTAVSLAGNNEAFVSDLIERFHNNTFRVYRNDDLIGVQLCGALKNILAIAVGIADGLNLGANTRCALITRGLAEMSRLCVALGGHEKTLMSLAGVGDLVLTCTDDQSRNRRFGLMIGQGESIEQALEKIGQAVEGLTNTKQVLGMAHQLKVDVPITEQVNGVLFQGSTPATVISELLERAPKSE